MNKFIIVVTLALLCAACGGGGNSSSQNQNGPAGVFGQTTWNNSHWN